eukprot:CAMPEP_0174251982 /NCGR_PEP_ID=MMETSP0439-20130205/1638_1 /TAXON_ID=0 /ORGANISM="Stereomyxa ramosa, Strain Chinc5" /LENGTH=565 /DNA_ID=CAMNT_0015332445 /DNA_START=29 /DNA_END=1726 /DNA_ORIENTATION=+
MSEGENGDVWTREGRVQIKASELDMGVKIAEGKYGIVYKGKCRGQVVAIKLLHNQHLSQEKLEELRTEVEIMVRLRHPCILLLMGVCTEPNNVALVMEYVDGKSLDRILHDSKIPLSPQRQLRLATEIAKGMNWLHCLDPPIIHRDIKPPNILVTNNWDVKVCDFGLSCVKEIPKPDEELRDTAVGSPIWMAPEVLSGHLASEKSDIYAYAIVLWEILTRQPPFSNVRSFEEFLDDVIDNHKRPPLPDDTQPGMKQLIEDCWHPNPKKRPHFKDILPRLDDILIDTLITDPDGKELWRACRTKEALSEHYPFFIAWTSLFDELCELVGMSENEMRNSKGYLCLRILLAEAYQDLKSSESKEMKVTCESWGRLLDCFGPLKVKHSTVLDKVEEICKQPWFHGAITSGDAEKRLTAASKSGKKEQKGSFLVRLSSNSSSCFTISRIHDSKIFHQRISRDPTDGDYVILVGGRDRRCYGSLVQLVNDLKNELNLKVACSESRAFALCFSISPEIESGGYLMADDVDHAVTEITSKKPTKRIKKKKKSTKKAGKKKVTKKVTRKKKKKN